MKVYLITEDEMRTLHEKLDLAFRESAQRANQPFDLCAGPGQAPTVYDGYRTANMTVCRWMESVGGVVLRR